MKQILRHMRRWRYKHLYRKLFMLYAYKFNYATAAHSQAKEAFFWITGEDWEDWY